jgi:hypothetical protein
MKVARPWAPLETPAPLLTACLRRREGREGVLAVDGPSSGPCVYRIVPSCRRPQGASSRAAGWRALVQDSSSAYVPREGRLPVAWAFEPRHLVQNSVHGSGTLAIAEVALKALAEHKAVGVHDSCSASPHAERPGAGSNLTGSMVAMHRETR